MQYGLVHIHNTEYLHKENKFLLYSCLQVVPGSRLLQLVISSPLLLGQLGQVGLERLRGAQGGLDNTHLRHPY
jgi:hypothetical protein